MADDSAELPLGDQQPRAHPTLDLIALAPAFYVPANGLDDGEGRLDHVGATECLHCAGLRDCAWDWWGRRAAVQNSELFGPADFAGHLHCHE